MTRSRIALGLTTLALVAAPAAAHNLNPPATKVNGLAATVSGTSVSVQGTATFGGQKPLSVGVDGEGDWTVPQAEMYDLVEARIAQLDANTGDLTFILEVADLPFNGSLPEAARYTWDFGIDMGGETPVQLQIDGKFTDVLRNQSTASPAFILRGNCTEANNIITCVKIADLTAEMIGSDDEIFIDIPKSILVQQANGSIDGRNIVPTEIFEGIVAIPSAYFSYGGTGDQLIQDPEIDLYRIGFKEVHLAIGPASEPTPEATVPAALNADGTFAGSLDTASLAPGTYQVVAKACFATNCGTKVTLITI